MEYSKLKHASNFLIAGSTGAGKSHFVKKLIEYQILTPQPGKIYWCYGMYQKLYSQISGVTFVEGLPSNLESLHNCVLIIDDLMVQLASDKRMTDLITKSGHHRNISIIFIVQNLFHKGSQMRDISLNCHYIVLFKNPRDKSQVTHLGRQLYPSQLKFFQEAFHDATKKPYSYLLVDLLPTTDDNFRLRTGIFPGDTQYVYQPK